jgi:hypothetical protein
MSIISRDSTEVLNTGTLDTVLGEQNRTNLLARASPLAWWIPTQRGSWCQLNDRDSCTPVSELKSTISTISLAQAASVQTILIIDITCETWLTRYRKGIRSVRFPHRSDCLFSCFCVVSLCIFAHSRYLHPSTARPFSNPRTSTKTSAPIFSTLDRCTCPTPLEI